MIRPNVIPIRAHRSGEPVLDLASQLRRRVVGQDEAVDAIVPFVELHEAGLSPQGRPVGVFLLLGPTGTGKTRTVESLAEALHGSEKNVLRVDCGEFQLDHEVAKLIGAPPGYLGHRETHPMLSQQKVNTAASGRSALSLVLFDEVEKAAPSMTRLLLGVLDKASLVLGDNSAVNFERSLIFLTSNLGAREMAEEVSASIGFEAGGPREPRGRLQRIGQSAVRRRFAPEFVNRIDRIIAYQPLGPEALERILDLELAKLRAHIADRLGEQAFTLEVKAAARKFLLERGTNPKFGARELKRVIHSHVLQPVARMVLRQETCAGGAVVIDAGGDGLKVRATG